MNLMSVNDGWAICPIEAGAYSAGVTVNWKVTDRGDQGGLEFFTVAMGGASISIRYGRGMDRWETIYDENGMMVDFERYYTYVVSYDQVMEPDGSMPEFGGEPYKELEFRCSKPDEPPTIASVTFSFASDSAVLACRVEDDPIGDEKGATHSKERLWYDQWDTSEGYTTVSSPWGWMKKRGCGMALTFSANFDLDEWGANGKYQFWLSGIHFCGETVDLSAAKPQKILDCPGQDPDGVYLEGTSGGFLGLWGPNVDQGPWGFQAWDGWIRAPYIFDFSGIRYCWMDGTDCDPEIYCSGIARYPGKMTPEVAPWKGRASELRAMGVYKQKYEFHSWDMDGVMDVSPNVSIWMDRHNTNLGIEIGLPPGEYKCEGAGWRAVKSPDGIVVASPVDGDYSEDGEFDGEPKYVNANGYVMWYKRGIEGYAIGHAAGGQTLYEQDMGGPGGMYIFGDVPNEPIDPETGFGPLDPWPAVSAVDGNGIISTSSPSFGHDATFIFEGWTLLSGTRSEAGARSDILTISHPEAVNIYGIHHHHDDWVGTNATTPDLDGNFTVNSAGGSIKLDIKNSYIPRQYLPKGTGAGDGQINVPWCYWSRRHDSQLGNGVPAETPDGVFCAMGWGYYRTSFKDLPLPCEVTCRITYYDDVGGVSDNHFTNNKRQTEYSYNPGELHTMERTVDVTFAYRPEDGYPNLVGWSPVLIDILDDHVPAVVTSIEWEFDTPGTYRMSDHQWTRDVGDRQEITTTPPYYRQTASRDAGVKFFENWRYSEGGGSAHYDGSHNRSLWNHDNLKGNVIERTCGYFNVSFGDPSGLDFTAPLTVGGWAGLATLATDAWSFGYSPGAEESCMKDRDGEWLKVLDVCDIVPGMSYGLSDGGTGVPVVPRVRNIRAVNGLLYSFRGTQYVGGRLHGRALKQGSTWKRARSRRLEPILRRPQHEPPEPYAWETFQWRVLASQHGHYDSKGAEVMVPSYDAGTPLYEYGKGVPPTVTNAGRVATREYTILDLTEEFNGNPYIARDPLGRPISMSSEDDGAIRAFYITGDVPNKMITKPFTDGHTLSSIAVSENGGRTYVGATNLLTLDTDIVQSDDGGRTWSSLTMANVGVSLINGTVAERVGQIYVCGWKDGAVRLAVSTDSSTLQRDTLDGTNTLITVCDYPITVTEGTTTVSLAPRSSLTVHADGSIIVAVGAEDGIDIYKCRDYRTGFAIVEG